MSGDSYKIIHTHDRGQPVRTMIRICGTGAEMRSETVLIFPTAAVSDAFAERYAALCQADPSMLTPMCLIYLLSQEEANGANGA